jgi:preprotein translocase subunit SecD
MNGRIRTRLIVIASITLLSIYLFAGFPPAPSKMNNNIRLGLDLKGGILLVLQVVTDDAVRAETDQAAENVRSVLQQQNILFQQLSRSSADRFVLTGVDTRREAQFRKATAEMTDWDLRTGDVPNMYVFSLKPGREAAIRDQAVEQAMNTIRNRVDQLGVVEPVIQRYGGAEGHQILARLPGIDDTTRVKDVIQATALLELKLVDSGPFASEAAATANYGPTLPADLEVLSASGGGPSARTYYVVRRAASVTGRDLKTAYASRDGNGHTAVTFNLTADGARRFSRLTEENLGRKLGIVLDGKVQSAPTIQARISDSGIIEGGPAGFVPREAQDLALVLRSGALPASIRYLTEEVVGPDLGADSIHSGVTAVVVALISVAVFMVFYYRMAGINAVAAMMLNIVILLGAIAYLGFTLTLPGIAGIALTIGVGIDSNVLIFERIREELRAGKTAVSAVATGFSRVFITLIDTHLAALISAAFLFLFGTGPIKGFAVTLVIGLISNMFTAVFVSRTLFEWTLARQKHAAEIGI